MLGDLKPKQYGGLEVQSNVVYGIVTLSHEGELAFFGAICEVAQHLFPALQPGTYTVTLSWNGVLDEKEVTITVDVVEEIELFIEMEE